jgi:hypothetical protein
MIEIRNKTSGPVQLVVKSFSPRREHAKALTVLNIPAKKTRLLKDEQVVDTYLERNIKWGLLSARHIPNDEVHRIEE